MWQARTSLAFGGHPLHIAFAHRLIGQHQGTHLAQVSYSCYGGCETPVTTCTELWSKLHNGRKVPDVYLNEHSKAGRLSGSLCLHQRALGLLDTSLDVQSPHDPQIQCHVANGGWPVNGEAR